MAIQDEGVRFREIEGRRSSQRVGAAVYAAAARSVDASLAGEIETLSDWRKRYPGPARRLVEAGARSSEAAAGIAEDGLAALRAGVEHHRDGHAMSLEDALGAYAEPRLETAVVPARGTVDLPELELPYLGRLLRGDEIRRQMDRWVEAGTVEPSCGTAVEKVLANPDWLDLADQRIALLGAASEMGPLRPLTRWGATVIALDLPVPRLWERILDAAREGTGEVRVPVHRRIEDGEEPTGAAGANLLTELPEVRTWLAGERPTVVLDFTYAEGAHFVLLAAATDILITALAHDRAGPALGYLATPTDVFAVPEEIVEAALGRLPRRSPIRNGLRAVTGSRLYRPSYGEQVTDEDGRRWGVVDCLVPQQGANYALAKNAQRWRATSADRAGRLVSANVAPATRTRSVMRNRLLAAAYRGATAFGVEVFEPATSSWLMAAMLVHDLRSGSGGGGHPFDLFAHGAAHGGIWRMPWEPRSVLPLAALRGLAGGGRR